MIRVHLSLEAAPPWAPDDDQYAVEIRTDPQALLAAADRWERALASFPTR
ncbi:WapI family immunity protein [Kitasatospora sp. NPDC004531]